MESVTLVIRRHFSLLFVRLCESCLLCFHVGVCLVSPWYHTSHVIKGLFICYIFMCLFFSCHFPRLLSVFLSTSRLFLHLPDIVRSSFWDFGQDAPPDGPIQGLAERLKTTILSSKAISTSLLYHRDYRKWKQFAISTFDGNVFPAKPFHVALYLQHLIEQSHSPSVIDSSFYITA